LAFLVRIYQEEAEQGDFFQGKSRTGTSTTIFRDSRQCRQHDKAAGLCVKRGGKAAALDGVKLPRCGERGVPWLAVPQTTAFLST
jgi:hypothetical protein